jgi:DNA-binding LacI/PurR family transcriptional regulator
MSLLQALTERRIAIPETVRVVGYDDLAIAQQTVPRLTSVRQNIADGAGHLVDLLLRRIAGEATEAIVMPPELIVRQSS